ncbi:VOC family protein [Cellulomonas dongxiuzhuiae]|uniref:VOC family protein n=1 Tax=Cellulomonas dongxiuzhuiae TaxID=2819979 RepID=UPI001AAF9F98|nr:VOC family protein [Cellulomonas dongxiuzhuiae]MBO3089166.1 VOC family protein [Cellulomonas dongxiuzhuiae]
MSCRLTALAVDAYDPARLARFWAGVLGREALEDEQGGALLPGSDTQLGLRFVPNPAEKAGRNGMHLHLTSASPADQRRTVDRALRLGAHHLDVGQLPDERHVVLADPEGNEYCVIEPGNAYLAGCGLLGELTCDGTRDVGFFWAEALGWPLVWDQDRQTAIQSPRGGTKISWDAWDGPAVAQETRRNRLRFEVVLAAGDLPAEIERLASLGATRLTTASDTVVTLADPDGNEFHLRADALTRVESPPAGPA